MLCKQSIIFRHHPMSQFPASIWFNVSYCANPALDIILSFHDKHIKNKNYCKKWNITRVLNDTVNIGAGQFFQFYFLTLYMWMCTLAELTQWKFITFFTRSFKYLVVLWQKTTRMYFNIKVVEYNTIIIKTYTRFIEVWFQFHM